MRQPPQIRLLPDGRRLHCQDGPIDLVIQAWGPGETVREAYQAAVRTFGGVLDALCDELPALRSPAGRGAPVLHGPVARRMGRAVAPFAADTFITPMAAVAGSVADHVLAAMVAAGGLDRAYVNNGGDIALHVVPGEQLDVGLVDRPDEPTLFDRLTIRGGEAVRGVATSGWRGRSFSLGIADSVTVLARSAAAADAAATVVANAVDLPGHPGVRRVPADTIQPDSDLGGRLVTRAVAPLAPAEREAALAQGLACAERLFDRDLVLGVVLRLQGAFRSIGIDALARNAPASLHTPSRLPGSLAHA